MIEGKFFWYDVMTTDVKAAAEFYRQVVGWTTEAQGAEYTVFNVGDRGVAGLMAIPAEADGARPVWMGYVLVADVDQAIAKIEKAGGKLHRAPVDVPGVIRFAVVADPHGAAFMVATPQGADRPALALDTPGAIGWHELFAGDGAAALAFYEAMFDWKKKAAVEMGPMGTYQLFATPGSDEDAGGIMTKPEGIPRPVWGYYFNVDAIDAGAERVKAAGGSILMGPHQVPGGHWIVQCADPQGAMFALSAPKR